MEYIIPFGGGSTTRIEPNNLINWVETQDQIPLTLALSIYTSPYEELQGYKLILKNTRFCVWSNKETLIVGCRGTSIGKPGGKQDINDDKVSFLFFLYCLYTLTQVCQYYRQIILPSKTTN